jgi:hypothetical protein
MLPDTARACQMAIASFTADYFSLMPRYFAIFIAFIFDDCCFQRFQPAAFAIRHYAADIIHGFAATLSPYAFDRHATADTLTLRCCRHYADASLLMLIAIFAD